MGTRYEIYYCEHCGHTLGEVTEGGGGVRIKCRKCTRLVEVSWESRLKGQLRRKQFEIKQIENKLKTAL
jgi:phage FluMu protein Com